MEFKIIFTLTGELCKIQMFFPSKDIAEAAGQLSDRIDAINNGAKFERYSFIFPIPEDSSICSTELKSKNILKTHKSITPKPTFKTAMYELKKRPISFLYKEKNIDFLL